MAKMARTDQEDLEEIVIPVTRRQSAGTITATRSYSAFTAAAEDWFLYATFPPNEKILLEGAEEAAAAGAGAGAAAAGGAAGLAAGALLLEPGMIFLKNPNIGTVGN